MHRIYEVTRVCFNHALLLQQPEGVADVAALHRSAVDQVESMEATARKAGFSAENARLIKYALVAFIDEVAQTTPGPVADFWADHLLQRDYFNEVRAGENFFVHLEKLLGARRDDEVAEDAEGGGLEGDDRGGAQGGGGRVEAGGGGVGVRGGAARSDAHVGRRVDRDARLGLACRQPKYDDHNCKGCEPVHHRCFSCRPSLMGCHQTFDIERLIGLKTARGSHS